MLVWPPRIRRRHVGVSFENADRTVLSLLRRFQSLGEPGSSAREEQRCRCKRPVWRCKKLEEEKCKGLTTATVYLSSFRESLAVDAALIPRTLHVYILKLSHFALKRDAIATCPGRHPRQCAPGWKQSQSLPGLHRSDGASQTNNHPESVRMRVQHPYDPLTPTPP